MSEPCPFCNPSLSQIFYADDLVAGLWDDSPVAPGHALLIPCRHIASWFEANPEEQGALLRVLEIARQEVMKKYPAEGFNVISWFGATKGRW